MTETRQAEIGPDGDRERPWLAKVVETVVPGAARVRQGRQAHRVRFGKRENSRCSGNCEALVLKQTQLSRELSSFGASCKNASSYSCFVLCFVLGCLPISP